MKKLFLAMALLLLGWASPALAQQPGTPECTQPSCFQPRDKELDAISNLNSTANQMIWYTAPGVAALAPITAYGRSLLAAGSSAALGLTLEIPRVTVANLPTSPVPNAVVVVTDALSTASCTVAGGVNTNVTCQWTGTGWVVIGGGGASSFAQLTGTATDAQIPNLNTLSTGLTGSRCVETDGSGLFTVSAGACAAPATAAGVSFAPAGTIGATTVQGAIAELDTETQTALAARQPLDGDLTAIGALTGTGAPYQTAANTWVQRALTGTTGNIVVTNPLGVAGPPTFDLGATAVQTDQGNTYTTGDQSMAAASSFTFPTATGAAPTVSARCAYDSTAHRMKCGFNGTTVTLSITSEVQPLSTLLTAFSNLSAGPPAAGQIPYFTSATTLGLAAAALCTDTGGQHVNITSTNPLTFTCGTSSSGGLSGLTTGNIPKAASATTLTPSIMSEAAGVVTVAGGLVVGSGPSLILNTSAITPSDITWSVLNFSGTVRPSTGALTVGNMLTTNANGLIVDGGAAGTGTWTDSSTNTGTNKTLNPESTGNQITQVSVMQFDMAACADGSTAGLQWDADATGLAQPTATCNDTGSIQRPAADFSGTASNAIERTFRLPTGWTGNIDWKMRYVTTAAAPSGNTRWEISTVCRAVGESWDASFNTAQGVTDAVTSQNFINEWVQAALTTTGCAAGEDMTVRVARIGGDGADTNDDVAKGLYGLITLRWIQVAQ